eukprot:1160862-Pelagomonas_calceolata.AAC.3
MPAATAAVCKQHTQHARACMLVILTCRCGCGGDPSPARPSDYQACWARAVEGTRASMSRMHAHAGDSHLLPWLWW